MSDIKQAVRDRYGAIAPSAQSLGLGDVVELAKLQPGETVLDLGSGPGGDVVAASALVGPHGRAIGIDMTPEMIQRARLETSNLENVSIIEGDLEGLPLPCGSIDVVISNCVINLTADKKQALTEAFRVLRPGGRLAILDTAFETEPSADERADTQSWTSCVAGSLVASEYKPLLDEIGFTKVEIQERSGSCGESCGTGSVLSLAVTATKPATAGPSPASSFGLRPAVNGDRPAIESLLRSSDLPTAGLMTQDAIVELGETGVTGVVALERYGTSALLRSLTVSDPKNGSGSRLVIAALEAARWSGIEDIFLTTLDAESFFVRFGFKTIARKQAGFTCASDQLLSAECDSAATMQLSFEDANLPLLDRPSVKRSAQFEQGTCC